MIGVDPRLRPALDVKWLSSMRRLGAVLKASPDGLALDFRIATDAGSITDADLPLAPRHVAQIRAFAPAGVDLERQLPRHLDARELAGKLLARRLKGPAAIAAPLAVSALRDLTGSLTIDRSGLRGHFGLKIVRWR
jgi:hypothetical protein